MKIYIYFYLIFISLSSLINSKSVGYNSKGWAENEMILAPNSQWILMNENFTARHTHPLPKPVPKEKLMKGCQTKRGVGCFFTKCYFRTQLGLWWLGARIISKVVDCKKDEICSITADKFLHYQQTIATYPNLDNTWSRRAQKTIPLQYHPAQSASLTSNLTLHFKGPSKKFMWFNPIIWREEGVFNEFSVCGKMGSKSSKDVSADFPLALLGGNLDGIVGLEELDFPSPGA